MTDAAATGACTSRSLGAVIADYVAISKPRIILLLLVVAWASLFVAATGVPDLRAFLLVTAAGVFSTAASGAFNHVLERDRDQRMGRTADRPVASGRIQVPAALAYAAVLTVAAWAVLWFTGYSLAAWLTLGAVAFYVVAYTVLLKPRTAQNIVLGGFAGSFPALIAWAAATGTLGWPAWVLAGLVFLWTPPHFWALALLYQEDYAAADYPMMPSVRGVTATKRLMVGYAGATAALSLALFAGGVAGWVYLAAAVLLGGLFVSRCAALLGTDDRQRYRSYFLFTIQYLGFLLLALILDQVVVQAFPAMRPL